MRKLRQYVDLIQQFKVKKQEINALLGSEQTKIHRFFEGIATRRWADDEDAIVKELYGETFDTKHAPFRALKTELKKKLKNMLFLIDFKQPDILNDLQQAHYEVLRMEAAMKILIGRGKVDAGIDLAHHLLDIALKFELTNTVVVVSNVLRNHYRYMSPNQKKYDYYRRLYDEYADYQRLESLAEFYYCDVLSYFSNNRATKKWLQPIIQDYVSELLPHKGTVKTYQFLRFLGLLEVTVHMVVNDYRATLAVCDDYIAQFERKSFAHNASLIMLYHQKQVCHLMLREHEASWKSAKKAAKWVIYGSHNWFKDGILFIQLCFHTGRNTEAMKTFLEVFKHEEFKNQPDSSQEELKIYQGYIQWLIAVGKIRPTDSENQQIGSFRLTRFLNGIPTFSRDKRGLNVPILMLQILWAVAQKDYDALLQCLAAVSQYRTRHLKDTPNSRTNLLIKMLLLAPELNYDVPKIKQKAEKSYNTLLNITYSLQDETHEVEAFPYDMYWLYFLEMLESKTVFEHENTEGVL